VKIELEGLEVFGHHGVLEEERRRGQLFVVDVKVEPRSARSGETDDIADTADYREIVAAVEEIVGRRTFNLLEAVATALADDLIARLPLAWVEVTVRKPDVVLAIPVQYSAVTVERYAAATDRE
jgi:dihydroneopterin aldolase